MHATKKTNFRPRAIWLAALAAGRLCVAFAARQHHAAESCGNVVMRSAVRRLARLDHPGQYSMRQDYLPADLSQFRVMASAGVVAVMQTCSLHADDHSRYCR